MLEAGQITGVWVAGFEARGALAVGTAAEDERVHGVASLGAPADFHQWAEEPLRFLERARSIGVVRSPDFPPDVDLWERELHETRPLALIGKIPPRPVLVVHGLDDADVSAVDARALADAAE